MATILLIEPHPLLRLGLRQLLAMPDLAGPVIDIDPGDLPPDDACLRDAELMIFGWHPHGPADWRGMEKLCRWLAPQRVLVLADGLTAAPSQLPGAVCGLLSKTCNADVLRAAIRLVLAGGECFPAPLPASLQRDSGSEGAQNPPASHGPAQASAKRPAGGNAGDPFGAVGADIETPSLGSHLLNITERQYEVLALLARGYPIKTVSRMLNISVATAKTHACTLYQRLQVRNKGEAVYEALRRGARLNWPGPATPLAIAGKPGAVHVAAQICQAA
ncbi:LuxR C-terminal-related transcriptional regulator [Cupriavidus sp. AU9028]|uniref:response regulator transcription factor n=1 Tax=Cupriavidus sp. AU9028 TaxID=2871157 RepID=UPI001C98B6E9|nr:LuxR C-terminal-related transcriptional regulator [Cupriavidus sp. AU9028]MBY4896867.1 LuxR C-terminal-related transcriptional regulator [Cupriavidus sp. AU9028]